MFLNDQPATEQQSDLFRTIKIDQAIGMVTEAELEMELRLDETGRWVDFDEELVELFARIRIEVKVAGGEPGALIDGPVIGQNIELSAAANESRLRLLVHDDSVRLNQEESVVLFEEMSASDIARQLFDEAGLEALVDEVPPAGGTLERTVVQRGTQMQLLRDLARRHGLFVYVEPGTAPGASVGVFRRPDLSESDLPELRLTGEGSNLGKLSIELDGLRPFAAAASQLDLSDQSILRADARTGSQEPLGDEPVQDLVEPASVLLARTRETGNDLDAAVTAAVDYASWAYSAGGEVDAASYPAVMRPHGTVRVAGAGPMSGLYLIGQVTHTVDDQGYRQRFTLRRNARSSLAVQGSTPAGGVF